MFPPSQSLLIFFYVFIFVIVIFISLFIVLFLYRVGNGGEIGAIHDKYFRIVERGFNERKRKGLGENGRF